MGGRDFKQDSLRHFNRIGGRYDSHRYGKQTRIVHQQVVQMVNEMRPTSVLDVGCGNGSFLELLQSQQDTSPSRMLAGADLSPEMIKCARQRLGEKVDLREADSEQLPWNADEFDCLTCNYSFHHYPNPTLVLVEMRRVLKPGGHVILADPWFPRPLVWLANFAIRISHLGDVRIYSTKEWQQLLNSADLRTERIEPRGTTCYVKARKQSA